MYLIPMSSFCAAKWPLIQNLFETMFFSLICVEFTVSVHVTAVSPECFRISGMGESIVVGQKTKQIETIKQQLPS